MNVIIFRSICKYCERAHHIRVHVMLMFMYTVVYTNYTLYITYNKCPKLKFIEMRNFSFKYCVIHIFIRIYIYIYNIVHTYIVNNNSLYSLWCNVNKVWVRLYTLKGCCGL